MLTLDEEQFEKLNDAMEDIHQARMVDIVARNWPGLEKALDNPEARSKLDALILKGRERAAKLNIVDSADSAVFAALMVASAGFNKAEGAQFREWVVPFLENRESAGMARMALAERALRRRSAEHPLARKLCALVDAVRTAINGKTA